MAVNADCALVSHNPHFMQYSCRSTTVKFIWAWDHPEVCWNSGVSATWEDAVSNACECVVLQGRTEISSPSDDTELNQFEVHCHQCRTDTATESPERCLNLLSAVPNSCVPFNNKHTIEYRHSNLLPAEKNIDTHVCQKN